MFLPVPVGSTPAGGSAALNVFFHILGWKQLLMLTWLSSAVTPMVLLAVKQSLPQSAKADVCDECAFTQKSEFQVKGWIIGVEFMCNMVRQTCVSVQKNAAATCDRAARKRGRVRGMSVFVVVCQGLCRLTHTLIARWRGGRWSAWGGRGGGGMWLMECWMNTLEKVMSVCSQHKWHLSFSDRMAVTHTHT